jgi:hypothetical protein
MAKHGDINQETGMVFWSYDSEGNERWFDPARFLFRKNVALRNARVKYWKDPEKSRTKVREYGAANRQMKRESFKKWAMRNKPEIRNNRLKRDYGISSEDYSNMLTAQYGKCAICGTNESAIRKTSGRVHDLCVDHCHTTGKVRGLLCVNCNVAIGKLKDNPLLMLKAAEYVQNPPGVPIATNIQGITV